DRQPLVDRMGPAVGENSHWGNAPPLVLPAFARASARYPCDHPHPWPLVVCQVAADEESSLVIEVALERDAGPDLQAGAARLVGVMAEIAGDFHRRRELTKLRQRDVNQAQFAELVSRMHAGLDPVATAYAIANDGRQWIGCDRVSVLRLKNGRAIALAVSAVDHVDRSSRQVAALERLAAAVAASGEPLTWREDSTEELPPQLAGALQDYLDLGHARQLVAIPLRRPDAESKSSDIAPPHGLLVAESFVEQPVDTLAERAGQLARLSGSALGNALAHHALPLLPLQKRLAKMLSTISRRPIAVALSVAALAVAITLLAVVPADFTVEVEGTLQPQVRRNLFAPSDGIVEVVHAAHGQRVAKGDMLLTIASPGLDLDESRIGGELRTAQSRLDAVSSSRSRPGDAAAGDQDRLASEEEQLKQQIRGLEAQLQVLRQLRRELDVASPLDGIVLTWNPDESLANRPVKQGQTLLTIADPAGPWVLELDVPDRETGHVLAGQRSTSSEKLPVTFLLASDPAMTYRGHLDRMAQATDAAGGKAMAQTIAALDSPPPADARAGSRVMARIHCGRRSVGYVWLHDLIDFVRTSLLF
ncbi:MAG: efflux RND transporter periplasmic adaptor subunit, partial [Planctomycetaceae bacterium]|nr:efflux RND transporter periplasmic adaptor subunit [Planctomycetaceae bacterium]